MGESRHTLLPAPAPASPTPDFTMRIVLVITCCVAAVVARPQAAVIPAATPVPILLDERLPIDALGGYGFRIQTGNGISWQEAAVATGLQNVVSRTGQYTFTHPDGTPHTMSYTAGVGGFRPQSNLLPTPYPLTDWQIEQVRFAESQRAAAAAAAAAAGPQV